MGVKKNREFANNRHTVLNFAHSNDINIQYFTSPTVLIFSI